MQQNCGIRGRTGFPAKTALCRVTGLVAVLFLVTIASGYTDSSNGFSIDPPAGWTTDTSHANGELVSFKAPDGVSLISVMADNNGTPSIDAFIASARADLAAQTQVPFQQVSDSPATIAGQPGRTLVYTADMMGVPLQVKMDFVAADGRVFAFFLTSFGTNYDQYQPLFDASVNTIRFSAQPGVSQSPTQTVSPAMPPGTGDVSPIPTPANTAAGNVMPAVPSAPGSLPPTRASLDAGVIIFGILTIVAVGVTRRN